MDKALTTSNVPPQFLYSAFLLGHVPWQSLSSDPRVSYGIYVPAKQYNPELVAGSDDEKKLPLLVYIHGTRRMVSAIQKDGDLISFAESTPCAVLAPLFPAGLDGPNDLDSYKLLRSKTLRSDQALWSILDEVAHRWPGISTKKVFLMGFSGGGQFAHRLLYLYPERVAAVSAGAPGMATVLDDAKKWPAGVADVESLFGKRVQKDLIRQVQIQLVVGSEDNALHGGEEFWEWVREMKARMKKTTTVDSENKEKEGEGLGDMRKGRLDTLRELQALWKQDNIEARLDIVEGMAHEEGPARQIVLEFLRSAILGKNGDD